jgi:NAD(P)-dependent dehydrogenase (short-subunit alcohol dehydrogenase family)
MDKQKSAIVTGASSGIGREVTVQLAREGYHVLAVGRDADRLQQTAELAQLAATSTNRRTARCVTLALDLEHDAAGAAVVNLALKEFNRIDAIANVAGHSTYGPIEHLTPKEWRRCIDANLSSLVSITAAAWSIFIHQHSGVIVNVSSMSSIDPFPGLAAYAAAKAAVNMFTLCTAREGQPHGIRAVTIAPGSVETPMLRTLFDEKRIPRSHTLTPAFVAEVICGCITGKRAFESGKTLIVPSPFSVFTQS